MKSVTSKSRVIEGPSVYVMSTTDIGYEVVYDTYDAETLTDVDGSSGHSLRQLFIVSSEE